MLETHCSRCCEWADIPFVEIWDDTGHYWEAIGNCQECEKAQDQAQEAGAETAA